jgi:hypothetical protein
MKGIQIKSIIRFVRGSKRKATRDTEGAISCKSSSNLPLNETSMLTNPVMFAPDFAKLATNRVDWIRHLNTIGMVWVSACFPFAANDAQVLAIY